MYSMSMCASGYYAFSDAAASYNSSTVAQHAIIGCYLQCSKAKLGSAMKLTPFFFILN